MMQIMQTLAKKTVVCSLQKQKTAWPLLTYLLTCNKSNGTFHGGATIFLKSHLKLSVIS